MKSTSRVILMALLLWPSVAATQTGTASVLCENPKVPTDKRAFDIHYDRQAVSPSGYMLRFDKEFIAWSDKPDGDQTRTECHLDRSTSVAACRWIATGTWTAYNCRRVEPASKL